MLQAKRYVGVKLTVILALVFAGLNAATGENFVFENGMARLEIGSDGVARSLINKQNQKEQLRPGPFTAVRKGGHLFAVSAVERRGALFHVTFATSGVSGDYRITALAECLVVELVEIQGEGIEEVRLMQLNTPLANVAGLLGVRWDNEFAVCLMALSERVDSKIVGSATASVYPEFSMQGQRVAIIAAPTPQFLEVVRKVEHDFQIPSPTIGGRWAKISTDARTNYLFTDLTEANADQTIRYAKIAGFRYILIYASTWSTSLGSYPINLKSFPHGEAGLKSVIDKCHAAGLKVGMHMLMGYVQRNDRLVQPKPDPGLLKDGDATLATDVSEKTTELTAISALSTAGVPVQTGSSDIVINDEIMHCGEINGTRFIDCQRGFAGTRPGPHKAGARLESLAIRSGSYYIADPNSLLERVISDRISGVINRAGFDMIYFDGGGVNSANRPSWYWEGTQALQIWEQSKRDLLVQGGGISHWAWHIFSRGTCDDYAAVAVKPYLDYHKIADSWRMYHNNFLPAELGWVGFLQDEPDHPATTPDELEYYAVRMLALDSAISLETSLSALQANGRTEEMLKLLGEYEQLRLSGAVPNAVREQLAQGEWHMTRRGEFHPIWYDAQWMAIPGEITSKNGFAEQPLKFRLQVAPELATAGDRANIPLLRSEPPVEIRPPSSQDAMPGALAQRVDLSKAVQDQGSMFVVGAGDRTPGKALDLTRHRALAVQLEVEGPAPVTGESPVVNLQLEAGGKAYRDYYIDLDFRGFKTVILPEPGTSRMLAEFRPAYSNYPFKAAMYGFNYGNVVALNLRWMRYAKGSAVRCRIGLVEALEERSSVLKNLEISAGSVKIAIPGEMKTGDYAEYWGEGPIRIFERNGVLLRTAAADLAPVLRAGGNRLTVTASGPGNVKLTTITLGK
jgi:hypothetical protein